MRLAKDITLAGGVNSYSWDGKDDMGDIIEHGAYTYVISAHDDKERGGLFDPEYIPGSVSITDPSVTPKNYDPFRNDPIYINYTLAAPAWVTIGGQYPADFPGFVLEGVPRDAGPQTEIWNARDGFGTILQEDFTLAMKTAIMPDVFSVVQDDTLSIDTLLVDSYRLLPAYNEISTIYYSISRMADVTIKMVSPNGDNWIVAEFTGLEAGDHTLEWNGTDALGRQVSVEGDYRLELTAMDPIANTTRMRTANITVYK